jgi:carboxyl-terminal processing protease
MENPDSIAFSDTIKYYTPGGKVVYGGGGIMPDVYVSLKRDERDVLYNRLVNSGTLFQFAFEYTDTRRQEFSRYSSVEDFIGNFDVSGQLYSEMLAFARKQGLEYTAKESADSEKKIRVLLKAYIGRNLYDDAAFYPVYHEIDDIFQSGFSELD